MQFVRSQQANTVGFDVLSRTASLPVTEGVEVTLYLVARSGDNAGKWWAADAAEWSATEAAAGTAAHESRGHWIAEIAEAAWTAGVSYRAYGVADDDDYIVHSTDILCLTATGGWPEGDGTYPVSVVELKAHLRIDADDDTEDLLLAAYIAAATQWCEEYNGRKFLDTTCVEVFDAFPTQFEPRNHPLSSVTSIVYTDTDGDAQTLDAADYQVDTQSETPRIVVAYNGSWPDTRAVPNAVTLTYVAGYGADADDVPQIKRHAILMLAGSLYENRETTSPIQIHQVPYGVTALLGIDRRVTA